MPKEKDKKIRELQGQKSRQIASQNLTKLYLAIAEKPMSFSELLNETQLSKPVLMKHLRTLQQEGLIYKDTIKPTQTSNPSEIGKIVYKIKEDEMLEFLYQTIHMNFTVAALFMENRDLYQKLENYAREIASVIADYINQLRANRERILQEELKRIKR